jgi:(2R)-sulfolactate sulfo-lyase subunit alpha
LLRPLRTRYDGAEAGARPILFRPAAAAALPRYQTQSRGYMIHFLVHDKKDSVGVAVIEGIKAGQELIGWVMEDDSTIKVKAINDIPIGHKVATQPIRQGDTVIKYGFDIGKAVADIKVGEHAHVHNIKTKRW